MNEPTAKPAPEEPTPEPSARFNRQHVLMLAATFVTVFVVALLAITLLGGDSKAPRQSASNSTEPQSQLAPKRELKVGAFRYMSPCQVLPLKDVTKIMGNMSADGYISEDSLAVNYTDPTSPARTQCEYNINRDTNLSVYLSANQYADASKLKRLSSLFLTDPDVLALQIAKYHQTASDSQNKDAKAYVAKLETSLETYKKYADAYSEDALKQLNPSGLTLPGYLAPVGYIYGNVFYTIDVPGYDSKNLTAEQMAKLNGLLSAVMKHARNKQLDQSPAPTYLNSTAKVGSTKLLEPCTILTTADFTSITGVNENDLLTRLSLRAQPGKELKRSDNSPILPTNSCERTARNTDNSRVRVELQLWYGRSNGEAQAEYAKYNNNGSAEAPLQTSADEAKLVGSDNSGATASSYIFRVGPYFAQVRISNLVRSDTTYGNQDQHVSAINLLAERLKTANR